MRISLTTHLLTTHLLLSAFVIVFCNGRTIDDLEDDSDDDYWPVFCPPHNYYNRQLENCVHCSGCPLNTIITSPCYRFQDTKCGPFLEFDLANAEHRANSEESQSESQDTDLSLARPLEKGNAVKSASSAKESLEEQESRRQWSVAVLKMSLIIGGFVVLIVVVVIVSVVCIKRRAEREKKLVCEYMPPPGDVPQC
ncbi:uncharacterized protein LOC106065496 [Biomphalaria glabrata]|uniref:Uncharacterized protein LOC106065496 n=1 Tax=Biomphalaria glabrata TaxID=6526 RepID=A0A9U8EAT0_BIOGL|nr:uncharacterized protein LOC106065496 [Biomphalaria glabrata]